MEAVSRLSRRSRDREGWKRKMKSAQTLKDIKDMMITATSSDNKRSSHVYRSSDVFAQCDQQPKAFTLWQYEAGHYLDSWTSLSHNPSITVKVTFQLKQMRLNKKLKASFTTEKFSGEAGRFRAKCTSHVPHWCFCLASSPTEPPLSLCVLRDTMFRESLSPFWIRISRV